MIRAQREVWSRGWEGLERTVHTQISAGGGKAKGTVVPRPDDTSLPSETQRMMREQKSRLTMCQLLC